jgi:hypothetical protein
MRIVSNAASRPSASGLGRFHKGATQRRNTEAEPSAKTRGPDPGFPATQQGEAAHEVCQSHQAPQEIGGQGEIPGVKEPLGIPVHAAPQYL